MRKFQCIVEHFEIFFKRQCAARQTLLIDIDIFTELLNVLHKEQLSTATQRTEQTVMIFGILTNPRIAIVNERCVYSFICNLWQNDEPFLKKFGLTEKILDNKTKQNKAKTHL